MADTARRVALTRKVSLADYADGWDDCYAIVTLAGFDEVSEAADNDYSKNTNLENVAYEIEVVKRHFVSGKIRVLGENGQPELVDMTSDDVRASIPIADKLYAVIMGLTLDPKGMPTEATPSSESTIDSNTTKTT